MIDDPKNMTCEEFQAHMPELIGSGADASVHPHVQNCALCRALLADLETIAEAARQLFPVEDPPDRLWEQIQSAIKQEEEPSRG
jgi:predicted anti-sigma-YlaC factor YlaD